MPLICIGYLFRWAYKKLRQKYAVRKIILGALITYIIFKTGDLLPWGVKREILDDFLPGCLYILFLGGLLRLTHKEEKKEEITESELNKDIGITWLRLIPVFCGIGVFFINHFRILIYHWIWQPEPPLVGWNFSPFDAWINFLLTVGLMIVGGYLVSRGYRLLIKWHKKLYAILLVGGLGVFVWWNSMWFNEYNWRNSLYALMNMLVYMIPFVIILLKCTPSDRKSTV